MVFQEMLANSARSRGRVIGGLKQTMSKRKPKASQRKALRDAISYFGSHREWMQYDEYLAAGYPIGSGVVESIGRGIQFF